MKQKRKLKKQKELEQQFGYDNILCYITTGLNMYISDGVVTEEFIDNKLEKIISDNLDKKNEIKDFNKYSMQLARELGLKKYYFYVYPESNGWNQLYFTSREDFYKSGYKYGVGNYLKFNHIFDPKKINPKDTFDHYELFRNNPFNDYWNPGVGPGEGNYTLYSISPVESHSLPER